VTTDDDNHISIKILTKESVFSREKLQIRRHASKLRDDLNERITVHKTLTFYMTFPNISQNSTVMESPIGIEYFLLLTFPRLRDADTLSIQFSFDSLPLFGRPFSLLHDDKLD
jgi:hypothetical protein